MFAHIPRITIHHTIHPLLANSVALGRYRTSCVNIVAELAGLRQDTGCKRATCVPKVLPTLAGDLMKTKQS